MEKIIWVLGSIHENADKSIMWHQPFPNFSNCDLLIVNLQTLDRTLHERYEENLDKGRRYIFDLLMTREKDAIFILNSDNYLLRWLPAYPILKKIDQVNVGDYNVQPFLQDYIKNVEDANYYIHTFDYDYLKYKTYPESDNHENYNFTPQIFQGILEITGNIIKNQAKQSIGGCWVYRLLDRNEMILHQTGDMIFLPPPTDILSEDAIDLIINNLLGKELKETPPKWEQRIDLPSLKELEHAITNLTEEKKNISSKIEYLEEQKSKKNYISETFMD